MNEKQYDAVLIGCIPVKDHPTHPTDQSPCTQEVCPLCKELMWLSQKKKTLRDQRNFKVVCLRCIAQSSAELELIDIGSQKKYHELVHG